MKRTETLRSIVAVCLVVVSASCVHKSGYRNRHSRANETTVNRVESRDDRVTEHTRIRMVKENGVYYVPIEVNGLNLRFIFDTGASSILLSSAEAMVMYRQGLISDDDILGSSQMQDASGGISTGVVVNLRAVKIGLTRQSPWRSLTKTPTIFNGLSFKFATFATWNIKQT